MARVPHGIDATERDQIVAALKIRPNAIDDIALAFGRSRGTINKIRRASGMGRRG